MVGMGILPNNMRPPLSNVTRHSGGWLYTPPLISYYTNFWHFTDLNLITEFDFLRNYVRFPWNICNGCGMPTETPGPVPLWDLQVF